MNLKTVNKLLKNLRSSDTRKSLQALRDLDSMYEKDKGPMEEISVYSIRFLRDDSEEVREEVSGILLRQSQLHPHTVLQQFRNLLQTLKWSLDEMRYGSSTYTPVTNLIIILGNLASVNHELGGRIAPVVTRALKYPLYGPQNPTAERTLFYMAAINVIGKIGGRNPEYTVNSVPHVFKSLVDSYRFDSWRKNAEEGTNNLRAHAVSTLTIIGRMAPTCVAPLLISGLCEEDAEVADSCKGILVSFTTNIKTLFTILISSLNSEKLSEREKVTEFIVELGRESSKYVIPLLGLALSDDRRYVRGHSASAMGSLLPDNTEFIPSMTPLLMNRLLAETDNEVKQPMANTLAVISFLNIGVFKDRIPSIIRCMDDDFHYTRWRMAQIIKNIGLFRPGYVVDAIPYLIDGLDDFHISVQEKCREALEALNVDKYEYLQMMRMIDRCTRALEKARMNGMRWTEVEDSVKEAIEAARKYRFKESIELSTRAFNIMEAGSGGISGDLAGGRPGAVPPPPDVHPEAVSYREMGEPDIPPPPPLQEGAPFAAQVSDSAQPSLATRIFDAPQPPFAARVSDSAQPPFAARVSDSAQPPFASPPSGEMESSTAVGMGIDEIFLMTTYGILIDHYTAARKSKVDEEILGSMLVAVKSFITDSFDLPEAVGGGKMNLNNIDFGDFSVILSTGKYLTMVAIITSGNKDAIYSHITRGVERIEERYRSTLDGWDGDMEALSDLAEYMKEVVLK